MQAQNMAAKTPGVMGVGLVPVDIGDAAPAYHYELRFDEVDVLIRVPPGTPSKQLVVDIQNKSLSVGIKGRPPYLRGALAGLVHADDAVWTVTNGELKIELTKVAGGANWNGCLLVDEGWKCEW